MLLIVQSLSINVLCNHLCQLLQATLRYCKILSYYRFVEYNVYTIDVFVQIKYNEHIYNTNTVGWPVLGLFTIRINHLGSLLSDSMSSSVSVHECLFYLFYFSLVRYNLSFFTVFPSIFVLYIYTRCMTMKCVWFSCQVLKLISLYKSALRI